ncbi:MAG TPA: NTP transferase domain-containing protein [Propionibacteriaceae bacterium]|nr:NTP transferase domain-containing protein [Propionibacteriaceae bacterium]
MSGPVEFDAVVLAGGQGSRLGGVSKADLVVGGVRLLDLVLDAARDARTRVVVGDVAAPPGVLVTREDPAGTGPAAGLAAGLAAITDPAPWTLVLACDLPDATGVVPSLIDAAGVADAGTDGCCASGPDGSLQWLLGLYRTDALRRAVAAYGDPRNRSVRGMLAPLALTGVRPADGLTDDLDTWADHARWNAHLRRKNRMREPEDRSQWRPFIDAACRAVDIDPALVDEDAVLTLTREVAHAGARPMAPVTAFVLGLAVGASPDTDPEYLRRVIEDAVSAAPLPPDA